MSSGEDFNSLIRFGAFEADLQARELRKHGLKIKLQDQPFQILALLLERPGEVVSREELHKKLWAADTFVDFDRGLNRAINRLRDALGDSSDSPRFIETLPRRGYRFVASVQRNQVQSDSNGRPTETPGLTPTAPPLSPANPSRIKIWFLVLATVLIACAAVAFYYMRRPPVPAERDTVVLADFDNRTGDPAFDYTLKEALAIDLQQSPFLAILSDQQMADTLRLMLRATDQRVTRDVAQGVCQRTGSKAVLSGSIASLGSEYVIGLTATDCENGEPLAQEQVRARRKEEVLDGVDKLAFVLRRKLGESLRSIQKYERPIHEALSTVSLEAFQAYADGERIVRRRGNAAAIPFFKRAIDLDPNFAYAHSALGLVYGALGEPKLYAEYTGRAYTLRGKVSEWEKFFISVQYYLGVTGEIEKALQLGQVWVRNYPRERTAHNRVGYAYRQLGQPEIALSELEQAERVGGHNPIDILALARTYMALERLREAKAIVREAFARSPEQLMVRQGMYLVSFLEGEMDPLHEQVQWAMDKPWADLLLELHSNSEAYFGHIEKARDLSERAVESAEHNDLRERAGRLHAAEAVREAQFGNAQAARRHVWSALASTPGPDTQVLAALALAWTGDASDAAKLVDHLNVDFPSSTLMQSYWLPTIRAEIELHKGNAKRAIELLQTARPCELADTTLPMITVYVRALAYLSAKQGPAAIAEFQKIIQHRGIVGNSPSAALAHLGLARGFTISGDTAAARAAYQHFFAMWKDADPEIPIFKQAKAEYAKI